MQPSIVNDCGVLTEYVTETVATCGHSIAVVNIAMGEDQLYRFGVSLSYSYGGFGFAPAADAVSFATYAEARHAGLQELLKHWHNPFPSDPASVHDELQTLREQVMARLRQPTLF